MKSERKCSVDSLLETNPDMTQKMTTENVKEMHRNVFGAFTSNFIASFHLPFLHYSPESVSFDSLLSVS